MPPSDPVFELASEAVQLILCINWKVDRWQPTKSQSSKYSYKEQLYKMHETGQ